MRHATLIRVALGLLVATAFGCASEDRAPDSNIDMFGNGQTVDPTGTSAPGPSETPAMTTAPSGPVKTPGMSQPVGMNTPTTTPAEDTGSGPTPAGPGPGAMTPNAMSPAPMVPAIDDPSISSPSVTVPDSVSHAMHPDGSYDDLRGRCAIDSGFLGDEACIPAPPEDEGFQIHIGPTDYDDPDQIAKFTMVPGDESSECWTFHTPNQEEIVYQTSVLSGRSGTHHIITTMYDRELQDGGFTVCSSAFGNTLGALPGASKPYMPRGSVAPENKNIGRTIPAHVAAQADMHYYNITDKPILREFWLNIYYATDEVTEQADQIRAMGGFSWNNSPIPPGADEVFKYECPVSGEGRILQLLGHYHAQGKRFTAAIRRKDGTVDKVFEMYDYVDPAIFEYNTLITNPEFSDGKAGAVSGLLDIHDGDTVLWECHIQNNLDVGLTYTNEVVGGEMCNLWGASIGVEPLNCLRP